MNSGCDTYRLSAARRSTCFTTAASKPMPTWNRKYRPFTNPSPTRSMRWFDSPSSSTPVASIGSFGSPMVRANTLVDPPGRGASAVFVPARPLATSLSVPSPPRHTTTSTPSFAAPCARRRAWPRRFVSATVTSWSADSAFWMTTCPRAVTDDAVVFTISSRRTHASWSRPYGCWQDRPPMNIAVCVKQIPDPAEPGALNADHTLKRDGKLILDESDSYGVEMALQLVDKAGGGEVTLISMAPNSETSGLRTALAMCAAKAVLVSDDALKGAGALDTAKVLGAAIKRTEVDLVLAAVESSDGYTGVVPEQVAEVLDLPSVTFAKHIEIADGVAKVQRQTEAGYDEVECPLPCVVSVPAGVVEPRYPSFKGIMAAKSKPVDEVKVADLGLDAGIVGWAGAGQEIVAVDKAEERQAGTIVEDDGEGFQKIVEALENLKVI